MPANSQADGDRSAGGRQARLREVRLQRDRTRARVFSSRCAGTAPMKPPLHPLQPFAGDEKSNDACTPFRIYSRFVRGSGKVAEHGVLLYASKLPAEKIASDLSRLLVALVEITSRVVEGHGQRLG